MSAYQKSRSAASGRNLRAALLGQVLTVTVNLISRRIFIRLLGSEYAGFSGLCGHLMNFLSVIEPGFDVSCAFMLYRPLAKGDFILVSQICRYLRDVYRKISVVSLFLGLLLFPVALHFSDGMPSRSVAVIWLLSVLEMSAGFLFSHRRILPASDQKGYVITTYGYVFFMISQLLRLVFLVRTGSYIAYLAVGIAVGLLEEILLYRKIGRMYPYLAYIPYPLPDTVRQEILGGTRSLLLHKIGSILCGSVDNMSVFLFIGLHGGAVYSNYTMLLGTCLSLVGVLCGAVAASVGNLGVSEGRERMMRVYGAAYLSVFFAASLLSLSLFFTYPIIIRVWMGESMVLGRTETALFCISLFLSCTRRPTAVFIDSYGLFEKEKYKALIEAAISCTITLLLAPHYGIVGVLAGQISGMLTFSLWFEPYILYKHGFCESFGVFLRTLLSYLPAALLSAVLCTVLCSVLPATSGSSALDITLRLLVCLFSVSSVFAIIFFDRRAMRDAVRYGRRVLGSNS